MLTRTLALLYLLFFIVNTLSAQQEIPNGDFESWPPNNFGNPEFWDSPNAETSGFPFFLTTVSQTSDSHSGDYAAKVSTGVILGQIVPGVLTLGELILNITDPEATEFNGIPFTARPSGMGGFYKYSTDGNDFGGIGLLMTRFNTQTNQRDTIAFGLAEFTPQPEYKEFKLLVNYLSHQEPDSLNIVIISSASPQMSDSSELIIDDLYLVYNNPPLVDLGDDVYLCPGASHTFDIGFTDGYSYTWIDLHTGEVVSVEPTLTVDDVGWFEAVVQYQNRLPGVDTVEVFIHDHAPTVFDLLPAGVFCEESPSFEFILESSEPNIIYTLWKDGVPLSEPTDGTGNQLVFGPYGEEGDYFVMADDPNGLCDMSTDTINVQLVETPQVFSVTGGGSFPEGTGGVEVGLDGSQAGVNYRLVVDSETVVMEKTGTGEPLSFGPQGEGTYAVKAVNELAYCSAMMDGEAIVSISTDIPPMDKPQLTIYPNPATIEFHVTGLPPSSNGSLRLLNSHGIEVSNVYYQSSETGTWTYRGINCYKPGLYILKFSVQDKHPVSLRLIIIP